MACPKADWIISPSLLSTITIMLTAFERSDSLSCSGKSGASLHNINSPAHGVASCYWISDAPMTFDQAIDFCEGQLSVHLVFFDKFLEQPLLNDRLFPTPERLWLGMSVANSEWHWTHFATGTGTPVAADTLDWKFPPSPGSRGVVNFRSFPPGQWEGVDGNSRHFAFCEGGESPDPLNGLLPLPFVVTTQSVGIAISTQDTEVTETTSVTTLPDVTEPDTTPVIPPSFGTTQAAASCTVPRNSDNGRRYTLSRIASADEFHAVVLSAPRSLLSCVKCCLLREHCCYVGFFEANQLRICYQLTPLADNTPSINCTGGHLQCYEVTSG